MSKTPKDKTIVDPEREHEIASLHAVLRWPISHEPLRSDAKNLLPVIDEALLKAH